MSRGLSHITLISSDLDQAEEMLTTVFEAECVYRSGDQTFSKSEERFFMIGDVWVATMYGPSLSERTYNHIAFQIDDKDFDLYLARIQSLDLEILPPRSRVEGEGRSIYFYGPDNHLFELHTGTLSARLERYAAGNAPKVPT